MPLNTEIAKATLYWLTAEHKIDKRWWRDALHSQSACNLMALAQHLSDFMSHLREKHPDLATDQYAAHPIVQFFTHQMHHLSWGSESASHYDWAWRIIHMMTGQSPYREDQTINAEEKHKIVEDTATEIRGVIYTSSIEGEQL